MIAAVDNSTHSAGDIKEFDWNEFKFEKILSNNATRKCVFILGSCFGKPAIVILEKQAFTEDQFTSTSENESFLQNSSLEKIFKNDIYENCICWADARVNLLKASTIFPATEKHIVKYSEQDLFIVKETPEQYEKITLKFIEKEQFSLDWLYNVLDHKKEQDRVIIEDLDPVIGFMLLPDLKWDGLNMETLYVSALILNRNIKSIRDLREEHLPLLENIRTKCMKAIEEKYSVPPSQIRAYFHYQPSYYHLHVHFNYLKYDAPGILCDKAHLLDTVIDNIKLMPDYYKKASLNFVARANDKLYKAFKEAENQADKVIQALALK